jgi:lipoprotein-releasing system permease protein
MSRAYRFGAAIVLGGVTAAMGLVAFVVGLGLANAWVPALAARPERWPLALAGVGVAGLLFAAAALFAARSARRLQPGTRGRSRLTTLFGASAVQALASAIGLGLLIFAAGRSELGFIRTLRPADVVGAMPPPVEIALATSLGVATSAAATVLTMLIGAWRLLPAHLRRIAFALVDVGLVAAALFMGFTFPANPPTSAPADLVKPVVRLTAIALATLRLALRFLPVWMDGIERIGFRTLVAARHLRAKKSNFLAAISSLSILAVALSSCMLTTVLSVMGGFRDDLKQKILGNHAHVVVDKEHGRIEGWEPTLARVLATPGVRAATPVASGEVMVTSASNLAGGVLRGIDTATIGDVTDLERNLVRGRIEYLEHPERLLDLPSTERSPLGSAPNALTPPPTHGRAEGAPKDPPSGHDVDLDDFLREEDDRAPERDVLPGIILGRELARTLRVLVGDEIEVVSPLGDLGPTGPIPKTRAFRVAGIFYSGMYEYDMKHVYVTLPVAQRFLNMDDAITSIEITVNDVENAPRVAHAIAARIDRPALRVQDWQELNRNLFGALALEKLAMFVTLGIAILIAGFCVFGTLTLMVQEKGREVGILKAMGTASGAIIGVFLIEGLLIGLFGAALGLGLGFVVAFGAEHFGIRMNPEVYYIDRLPVHIDPTEFTLVGIAAVAVCLLATLFPAYLASSTRPVDALRYD